MFSFGEDTFTIYDQLGHELMDLEKENLRLLALYISKHLDAFPYLTKKWGKDFKIP